VEAPLIGACSGTYSNRSTFSGRENDAGSNASTYVAIGVGADTGADIPRGKSDPGKTWQRDVIAQEAGIWAAHYKRFQKNRPWLLYQGRSVET